MRIWSAVFFKKGRLLEGIIFEKIKASFVVRVAGDQHPFKGMLRPIFCIDKNTHSDSK